MEEWRHGVSLSLWRRKIDGGKRGGGVDGDWRIRENSLVFKVWRYAGYGIEFILVLHSHVEGLCNGSYMRIICPKRFVRRQI